MYISLGLGVDIGGAQAVERIKREMAQAHTQLQRKKAEGAKGIVIRTIENRIKSLHNSLMSLERNTAVQKQMEVREAEEARRRALEEARKREEARRQAAAEARAAEEAGALTEGGDVDMSLEPYPDMDLGPLPVASEKKGINKALLIGGGLVAAAGLVATFTLMD